MELKQRAVITGLGVVSCNGVGITEFWKNTSNGISGLIPLNMDEKFDFKTSAIGSVNDDKFSSIKNHRYLNFALDAAEQAINDSNIDLSIIDKSRFGVVIASAISDTDTMEKYLINEKSSLLKKDKLNDFYFSGASTSISKKYRAGLASINISTGCVAGLDALGTALELIRSGKADIMLAGASEAPLCPLSIASFEALGALSTRSVDSHKESSCPFSLERDGFIIAEGAGVLLVESYEHAINRGAKIYAELAGYSSINNAYHMTDLPENGLDMAHCIRLAIKDSGCNISDINYISAHGSSTKQNDMNETNAIKEVFKKESYKIPINSLKSMTGHALSAANAIETVALALEIKNKFIHPTINLIFKDNNCDLDYVPNKGRNHDIKSALKLTSGFSGIHSVIVMRSI